MIRGSYYKPRPKFFHGRSEVKSGSLMLKESKAKKLYLGIELEVEFPKVSPSNIARCIEDVESKWWYPKEDGSLKRGVEFVTHPVTYEWVNDHRSEINQKLEMIKSYGAKAWEPGTAGIHIHMSKSAFSKQQLWNFQWLIYQYPQFTRKLSGKTWQHLAEWSDMNLEDLTDLSLKSITKTHPKQLRDKCYKWWEDNGQDYVRPNHPDKYIAVNLINKNTVEVRIFRSSLNPSIFFRAVEFCAAAHEYSSTKKVVSLKDFIRYVGKRKSTYPTLHQFLSNYESKY